MDIKLYSVDQSEPRVVVCPKWVPHREDADIIPLFVQENYLQFRPYQARSDVHRMELVAQAAARISEGDVMNRSVRQYQNWGLMPYANMAGAVLLCKLDSTLRLKVKAHLLVFKI